MPASPSFALAVTELVYYCPTILPLCYCLWTHRRVGLLGWAFLLIYTILQITGSGLTVAAGSRGHPSTTAAIIIGVGISPLLLGIAGLVHELIDVFGLMPTGNSKKKGYAASILYHIIVVTGVALYAVGRSKAASNPPEPNGKVLGDVGVIILLVAWIMLAVASMAVWQRADHKTYKPLCWAVQISVVLLGIRLIYACVATFSTSHVFATVGGSIALKVVFEFLLGALVIAVCITGGVMMHSVGYEIK